MSLHTYIERMKYIDYLIRTKSTGDLPRLARKLNLSKSQTVFFLNEMKNAGFPINSRKTNSYYYAYHGGFVQRLFETRTVAKEIEMTPEELRKISGGKSFFHFFLNADYIGMNDSNFVFQSPH